MKRHSTSTLMSMTKQQLVEYVRVCEHNQEAAEEALRQQAENLKDWEPVRPELKKAVRLLNKEYDRAMCNSIIRSPIAYALYKIWKKFDEEETKNGR